MHSVKSIGLYCGWGASCDAEVYAPGDNSDLLLTLANELGGEIGGMLKEEGEQRGWGCEMGRKV